MGEVAKELGPGEIVLYTARVSPVVFGWPVAFTLFFLYMGIHAAAESDFFMASFFMLLMPPILILGFAHVRYTQSEYVITSQRVVLRLPRVAAVREESISLAKIEGITVDQRWLGADYTYGDVRVTGSGTTTLKFPKVADPFAFKRAIGEAVAEAARVP